ncbi:hypothetical protein ADN00_03605 [Ornatilinea apprima]|uniref:D-hydantoinase n=1 Tax=Ornatilinea apprima TaxID=1134406 RepID=A0A0P6XFN4_9CHLR|nr:dihydropyrimidinase [Ornatilinea apprima]KPL78989.1 hypothetical protein ADN00_03605 [Ornatilinea apprima]
MTTIIKNGTLITAADTFEADILIEGEKISLVGKNLQPPAGAEVIDASGKLVMPGGVDPHVHLNLPMFGTVSSDDHYTGHKAAAFGGTTTALDFIPHGPGSFRENIDGWHARADDLAAIDFGFHMNVERVNDDVRKEFHVLGEEGISSIKVFSAYNNRMRLQDGDIFRVLRMAGERGYLTMMHAENGDVIEQLVAEALANGNISTEWHAHTRPAWGAVEAALRGFAMAEQAGAPLYLVHMNTGGETDMLQYARERGLPVMGETCPQYMFFTLEDLQRPDGAKWICSPPMRSKADNERIWKGVMEGTIQTIGTDHCPFFYDGTKPILYEGKEVAIPGKELGKNNFTEIPNGLPGIGDRLPILWTYGVGSGKITANQFVALCSTNPAKIFGMYPRKGSLMPGADADIAIWDPEKTLEYGVKVAHHRTDYNLFEGWKLKGYPEKVFLRGKLIVDGQKWMGKAGMGRYLHRDASAEVL